ncbi:MAG: Rrf2 family transcriptional regulator [Defluviitaleaceae bacterium]|nr:Rrf2 family transcriptional regulator [Defluviitaleaceae bacterium]
MFLTMECDYGMRILRSLSNNPNRLSAKEIAKDEQISSSFAHKILEKLKRARIIGGNRGRGGGYFLIRPADSISLWDVYSIIAPDKYLCACLDNKNKCTKKTHSKQQCKTHNEMARIQQMMITEFSKISVADISYASTH